jgi:hypothetical protein
VTTSSGAGYAQSFDDVAEEYDRERRGYADGLIDAAVRAGPLMARRVAERAGGVIRSRELAVLVTGRRAEPALP